MLPLLGTAIVAASLTTPPSPSPSPVGSQRGGFASDAGRPHASEGCEWLPKRTLDRIVAQRGSAAKLSQLDIDSNEHFDVYERGPLPAVPLAKWLTRELGPKVELAWEATDCECCGDGRTRYCDVPLCGIVTATLPSGKPTMNRYGLRDRHGNEIRVYTFRGLVGMARDLEGGGGTSPDRP